MYHKDQTPFLLPLFYQFRFIITLSGSAVIMGTLTHVKVFNINFGAFKCCLWILVIFCPSLSDVTKNHLLRKISLFLLVFKWTHFLDSNATSIKFDEIDLLNFWNKLIVT